MHAGSLAHLEGLTPYATAPTTCKEGHRPSFYKGGTPGACSASSQLDVCCQRCTLVPVR